MFNGLYEISGTNGLLVFLLLTVLIGGGAAWRTGQAVAEGWGARWPVGAYTMLIAAAVRFLDYALFNGPLLSAGRFGIDLAFLLVLALAGYRLRRARHMGEQYPWLIERRGPLGWRLRRENR
jgi:Domain of unknown function (DUF6867)